MGDVEWELEPVVASIAARLSAQGPAIAPEFVADVVAKYVALVIAQPSFSQLGEQRALVRHIASSLSEDEAVIHRIVEELRSQGLGPIAGLQQPAGPVGPSRRPTARHRRRARPAARGFDPRLVAGDVANRLAALGIPLAAGDVNAVMGRLIELTGHGVPPTDPAARFVVAARVAEGTGRTAGTVLRVFDEVDAARTLKLGRVDLHEGPFEEDDEA